MNIVFVEKLVYADWIDNFSDFLGLGTMHFFWRYNQFFLQVFFFLIKLYRIPRIYTLFLDIINNFLLGLFPNFMLILLILRIPLYNNGFWIFRLKIQQSDNPPKLIFITKLPDPSHRIVPHDKHPHIIIPQSIVQNLPYHVIHHRLSNFDIPLLGDVGGDQYFGDVAFGDRTSVLADCNRRDF
jgi:hypothetical protein